MRQLIKHKLVLTVILLLISFVSGLVVAGQASAVTPTCNGVCQVTCNDNAVVTWDDQRSLDPLSQSCATHNGIKQVGSASAAAGSQTPDQVSTDNPKCSDGKAAGYDCIKAHYLIPLATTLSALVAVAVVAGIVIGGIQYSTSAGDPQKVAQAKARISKALIALIVYFFLFAILQFLVPGGLLKI
jgi:hypothetical protein